MSRERAEGGEPAGLDRGEAREASADDEAQLAASAGAAPGIDTYRSLFEHMAQGAFYQRADGTLVDANPAMLQILGVTREQVRERGVAHPDWQVLDESGAPLAAEQYPSMVALRTGEPVRDAVLAVYNPQREDYVWLAVNAIPEVRPGEARPHRVLVTLHDLTARRRAAQRARELAHQVDEAVRAGSVGLWNWALATGKVHYSAEWKRQLGYAEHELRDSIEEWRGRLHPGDREWVWAELERCTAAPCGHHSAEFRLRHKDGSYRWFLSRCSVGADEDGRPRYICGSQVDITERKRVERELHKGNARLQAFWNIARLDDPTPAEISDHVLATLTEVTDSVYCFYGQVDPDQETLRIHAWSAATLRDCAVADRPVEFAVAGRSLWAEAVRRRAPVIVNDYQREPSARHNLPPGHVALERLLVVPCIVNGRVVAVAAVANRSGEYTAEDASQVEAFLTTVQHMLDRHAAEARVRAILDVSPFPVAVVDTDDDAIEYWSRSARELFGHTAPTAREWYELAYPDPAYRAEVVARWRPQVERARATGQPVNAGEFEVTCADGCIRVCELHAAFIADSLIVTFNDVTARKRAEGQLVQADRLASMGLLAAGIAHEINNPLCFVQYNVESLAEEIPDLLRATHRLREQPCGRPGAESMGALASRSPAAAIDDVEQRLRDAVVGVRRIGDIARTLGAFARVEREERATADVVSAIEDAIRMARNEIRYRARLVTKYGPTSPVRGSEGRLAQTCSSTRHTPSRRAASTGTW